MKYKKIRIISLMSFLLMASCSIDMGESEEASSSNREYTGEEIETTVNVYELLGSEVYLYFNLEQFPLTARVSPNTPARVGDKVKFKFDMDKVHIFDSETGVTITN